MDYDLEVTVDGETLLWSSLMVDETERVCSMAGYANKSEWARACWNEEPAAQKAVYIVAKARDGQKIRWEEAKFRDNIVCRYVDPAGRHIVMQVQLDDEGMPVLDKDGDPKPVIRDGRPVLLYADTGEELVPTVGEETSPTTTSATPETPGESSESGSGTPTTEPS